MVELGTLFDVNFIPKRMTLDELEDGVLWLYRELDSEAETARRRREALRSFRAAKAASVPLGA